MSISRSGLVFVLWGSGSQMPALWDPSGAEKFGASFICLFSDWTDVAGSLQVIFVHGVEYTTWVLYRTSFNQVCCPACRCVVFLPM